MDAPGDQYPRGKLNDDDDGELEMAIGVIGETVIVRFGKPVTWFGMGAHEARGLAELLLKHADSLVV